MSPSLDRSSAEISYLPWTRLWEDFEQRVAETVRASGAVAVGELGGGATPTASLLDRVGRPIDLTVVDISADELARSPFAFDTLCVDLCADEPPVHDRFDLVFSRMLCEHVASGATFHRNCFAALRPGGHAIHFFPAVTALPSLVNRVIPPALSTWLLNSRLGRQGKPTYAKFPARYRWCWGPTTRQLRRYRSIGFEVVSFEVGIGHDYYERIPVLRTLEKAKSRLVLRHPTPWLASYVTVVLRRPGPEA